MYTDDDFEYACIMSPHMLTIPGVDYALPKLLRDRALDALAAIEAVSGIQENHPLLDIAITMDEVVACTEAARVN